MLVTFGQRYMIKKTKTFYTSLHGLRGLASFGVFIAHIINGYVLNVDTKLLSEDFQRITLIGTFGVEVFFFLSGFVIYKAAKKSEMKDFFLHRFWRIYPLFLLFTLVYFISNAFLSIDIDKQNLWYLFANLLFLDLFFQTKPLTPNAWSITYEIWYYLIAYFLVTRVKSNSRCVMFIVSILLLVYFVFNYPITIYFVLGCLLARFSEKLIALTSIVTNSTLNFLHLFLIISLFSLVIIFHGGEFWFYIHFIILPIVLFSVILLFLNAELVVSKALSSKGMLFLGNISYSLYLLHPYTYIISRKITVLFSENIGGALLFPLFLLITLITSIYLSFIINKYFENYCYVKYVGKSVYASNK